MSTDTPIAVEAKSLTKRFGNTLALDQFNLTVETGQVHGFLGPNGAGKSTTLRILLGLLKADSGSASILGADPWTQATEVHRRLAYVPGDVALWPNLTGGEVIELLGRLRGSLDVSRQKKYLDRFSLDPKKYCRAYSKGNRQKVALVAAFASDVELLMLDEPTSGLDPLMEAVFAECILEEKSRGRTILLSSHILSEVEQLCDHVTIIRAGRTVETGTLRSLAALTQTTLEVTLRAEANEEQISKLRAISKVSQVVQKGAVVHVQLAPEALDHALALIATWGVKNLVSRPPSLEEIFLQHYKSPGTDTGSKSTPAHGATQ